jgi:hypothetical protein
METERADTAYSTDALIVPSQSALDQIASTSESRGGGRNLVADATPATDLAEGLAAALNTSGMGPLIPADRFAA